MNSIDTAKKKSNRSTNKLLQFDPHSCTIPTNHRSNRWKSIYIFKSKLWMWIFQLRVFRLFEFSMSEKWNNWKLSQLNVHTTKLSAFSEPFVIVDYWLKRDSVCLCAIDCDAHQIHIFNYFNLVDLACLSANENIKMPIAFECTSLENLAIDVSIVDSSSQLVKFSKKNCDTSFFFISLESKLLLNSFCVKFCVI